MINKQFAIIIHGSDNESNSKKAYELACQYLNKSSYIESNTHPDFLLINNEQISIEDVRKINNFVSLKPAISSTKVVLIENSENMSLSAANAILKTLEEPSENVLFLLTTSRFNSILPTIRSRCLKLKIYKKNDYTSLKDYINNYDKDFVDDFLQYIDTKIVFDYKFAQKYSNNCFDFVKVCITYCHYFLLKDMKYINAIKILKLQRLLNITQNTYPNKEYVILIAMWIIHLV